MYMTSNPSPHIDFANSEEKILKLIIYFLTDYVHRFETHIN